MIHAKPLETDYVHALLARAPHEWKHVRLFRRNTGVVRISTKETPNPEWHEDPRFFRAGIPGQADLYAIANGGKHYEIECKRFGKLSEAQGRWREWCVTHAVPWILLEVRKREVAPETIARWVSELRPFFA